MEIEVLEEIDSTNAEARRRAEAGETGPLWITAQRQTAGRGRRGRNWETGEGNLAATLLLTTDKPPAEAAQVSFVAALAVADLAGLVGSVVAAFYYLRLVKVIWFDDATGRVDKPAPEAWLVAVVMALFSFPVVMVALTWLDPLARAAASIFG